MGVNKRTLVLSVALVTLGLSTLYLGLTTKTDHSPKNSWDILVFSQIWPDTFCYTLEDNRENIKCKFLPEKNIWFIHGIWPTKSGTTGPMFCNKSLIFDPNFIESIENKLNRYWTNLKISPKTTTEVNSSLNKKKNIWYYEWVKHGSCAVSLPALNSEFKYFNQGIEWSEKYNMKNVLEESGIQLNSSLYVNDYWKAVKSVLKTNTWIQCVFKHDTKEQLLSEIRICFDKTLKLIDCDGVKNSGWKTPLLTNCDTKKPILYLDYVPERITSTNLNSKDDEKLKMLFRSKRNAVDNSNGMILINHHNHNHHHHHHHHRAHGLANRRTHYDRINPNYFEQSRPNGQLQFSNPIYSGSSGGSSIYGQDWDTLIFSQTWPYTFCHTWTSTSNAHTCNLPPNRNQWTIHGIWPSKTGTFGPSFCNNKTSFNLHELDPVNQELHNRWTEVKASKTWSVKREGDLWKHEWIKHGTCAISSPSLNSEIKYFKKGLEWSNKYQLSDILSKEGIIPNGSYSVTRFWNTLTNQLGKKPRIDCHKDKNSNNIYIDEVRLCFDKTLTLIDCEDHRKHHRNQPNTNCPMDKDIYYLGAVNH